MKRIRFNLALNPRFILFTLCAAVFATILMGTLGAFLEHQGSQLEPYSFFSYFALGRGNTVPAFLSSFNLLLASFLLVVAAQLTSPEMKDSKGLWYGLALLCFILSVNEIAGLHEMFFGQTINQWVALTGYSNYALTIFGSVALLLTLACAVRLLTSLSSKTRKNFLLSGLVFFAGALGMEAVGAMLINFSVTESGAYLVSVVAEESLELLGVLLFIRSLLVYLSEIHSPVVKQQEIREKALV